MSRQGRTRNKTTITKSTTERRHEPAASLDNNADPQQKDTVTLSVRLTEEQKERLATAANLRGWTPTTMLRVAAMEKAAHVLNTTTPTNIDLRKLAETVAARLVGEGKQLNTPKELKALKMAAHYGGSEFLNMVIDGCMTVVARTRSDLPNPVDPTV